MEAKKLEIIEGGKQPVTGGEPGYARRELKTPYFKYEPVKNEPKGLLKLRQQALSKNRRKPQPKMHPLKMLFKKMFGRRV